MLKVELDIEELQSLINDAVDKAIERHGLKDKLPPVLTRKQFMELTGIGDSKCAELFNREDFPVIREFGYPRVITEKLFEWMEYHTNSVEVKQWQSWNLIS
ncbi:DNA-binding protein [Pontibacillus salicampi]|uniref:DNA-binding protein n=1 Tax=Pontibacillus salicampi TaxID=1449801 RepID=A0ABV6LU34_9BACI